MAKKNTKLNIETIPYLTRKHFKEIVKNGEQWDFNRQLSTDIIRDLPTNPNCLYPINLYQWHEHRRGEWCEPHVRLVVDTPNNTAIVDVPMGYFESLPAATKVYQDGKLMFVLFAEASGGPTEIRYVELNRQVRGAMRKFARKSKDAQIRQYVQDHLSLGVAA